METLNPYRSTRQEILELDSKEASNRINKRRDMIWGKSDNAR